VSKASSSKPAIPLLPHDYFIKEYEMVIENYFFVLKVTGFLTMLSLQSLAPPTPQTLNMGFRDDVSRIQSLKYIS
jgi:hypothetical protein